MIKQFFSIVLLFGSILCANPINNAYSWISQEYKDFRTYPRVSKAQNLLKENKKEEAKQLLEKALEIDINNKNATNLLLQICIQEKDNSCIKKYSKKAKGVGLGYFYKERAEEERKKKNYTEAIKFSQKALEHQLKEDDSYFVKKILFESYLKLQNYIEADNIINRSKTTIYKLFQWSKISENIGETHYAYSLAKELPNKVEYIQWRIALLLKSKQYTQASTQLEILNKIAPSKKNKKQLLYLYALTGQNERLVKSYQKKLSKGCDQYAFEFLLNHYKDNRSKKRALLEKHYPYTCLIKKRKTQLSLLLIESLKRSKPKKAKRIARELSAKVSDSKALIYLYQSSGENNKLTQLYKDELKKACNKEALYFLLEQYKHQPKQKRRILEKAYPYECLPADKQSTLSLELITLFGKKDLSKTKLILSHLKRERVEIKSTLYISNLESSLGNYDKSIEYATAYLQKYPNNIEAIKNIGYSYFKLGKKNSAVHYLMQASKLNPNDHELLKNIGYLCIDLERYDTASYYWNLYINKKTDTKIQLELASLYYHRLNKIKQAKRVLQKYEKSTKNYTSEYYLLKAKLSHKAQNCKASLKYYAKALKIEKNKHVRYEQIHLMQQCEEESKALKLMQKFVDDYPNNIQYQKELAYMYHKNKNYNKAIVNFKEIKNIEPQNVDNHTALAYTYKQNGQKEQSINAFKEAIDRSKNMNQQQRQNIKREITNASKVFHFYLVQSARLNSYKQDDNFSPVNSASYNGFGSMQLSYQPTFLPKSTTLYANIIHGHKKVKKTLQPSVGIRYKPLKDKEVYLSAEQLIKGGESSRSDTLLRASLGITGKPQSMTHENLYLEGAYFTKADATILYGNYEFGKIYKQSQNINITPYITTGVTYNNDNALKKSVTKMDIGVGVAVDMLSDESDYEIGKYRNKLKLEARQKYAGNSKDKQALRLQWEFFY
jgi:tetratricopeptide (TPR) repeat protein